MNWVRLGAAGAAVGAHLALLGVFVLWGLGGLDNAQLQSGSGEDDLAVIATIAMEPEERLGLDAVSANRQMASPSGQASPKPKEEVKKEEEKVELPPEKTHEPVPLIEEKNPQKIVEVKPSTPSLPSQAQEERRAASRTFEARRSQTISLYNNTIYQALMRKALRPKIVARGRVVVELTLSSSGELLAHRVVESSGSEALDRTAMTSLERAAPFPPIPPELGKDTHTLRVPFQYAVK